MSVGVGECTPPLLKCDILLCRCCCDTCSFLVLTLLCWYHTRGVPPRPTEVWGPRCVSLLLPLMAVNSLIGTAPRRFQHMHEGWSEEAGMEDDVGDAQPPEGAATRWNVSPEGTADVHGGGSSSSSSSNTSSSWNSTQLYRGMPSRALLQGPGLTDEVLASAGQFLDMAEKVGARNCLPPASSVGEPV
jgi:hypothetical protein